MVSASAAARPSRKFKASQCQSARPLAVAGLPVHARPIRGRQLPGRPLPSRPVPGHPLPGRPVPGRLCRTSPYSGIAVCNPAYSRISFAAVPIGVFWCAPLPVRALVSLPLPICLLGSAGDAEGQNQFLRTYAHGRRAKVSRRTATVAAGSAVRRGGDRPLILKPFAQL